MPTREAKETSVGELKQAFGKAQVAIVADYRGLTVKELTDLRRRLQKSGGDLTVAKNTLIRLVTKDQANWQALAPMLKGPTALVLGFDDPVTPAKVITEFMKEKRKVEIQLRGGVLEGRAMDPRAIKSLSELPSKEVLLSRMLASLNSPATGVALSLAAVSRSVALAVEGVRKQKETQSA